MLSSEVLHLNVLQDNVYRLFIFQARALSVAVLQLRVLGPEVEMSILSTFSFAVLVVRKLRITSPNEYGVSGSCEVIYCNLRKWEGVERELGFRDNRVVSIS